MSWRFWKAQRGNVGMILAICFPVLVLLVGGAIDTRQFINNRTYAQDAEDAAALAAAKAYYANPGLTPAQRNAAAHDAAAASFNTQIGLGSPTLSIKSWDLKIDDITGEITMVVDGGSLNNFAGILGYPVMKFLINSSAVAGGQKMELALILDNTSSMFDVNRFDAMREAAKDYVNTLYDFGGDRVRISVVPWTTVVNINSSAPAAANANAVAAITPPAAGTRVIPGAVSASRAALVGDPATGAAVSQAQLNALAAPTTWRGCIRSAPGEVKADASGKVTQAITDGAPPGRWPASILASTISLPYRDWCDAWTTTTTPSNPNNPGNPSTPKPPPQMEGSLDGRFGGRVIRASWTDGAEGRPFLERNLFTPIGTSTACNVGHTHPATAFKTPCLGSGNTNLHASGTLNAYYATTDACTNTSYWTKTAPVQNGTNLPCVSDPNELAYLAAGGRICPWEKDSFTGYNAVTGTASPNWVAETPISGPNTNCPVSMLPLSSNRKQVLDKLNEMYPVPGGTMADVGLLWGLRSLAPGAYWPKFWGLTDQPAPWKDKGVSKMAVLLTDGVNLAPTQYEGYYGCTNTGRSAAGNCWKSPNVAKLNSTAVDNLTQSACDQLRTAYGVELYVMLVDVTDPAAQAKALACVGGDKDHVIFTTTTGVKDAFRSLVERSLRLTH